MSILLLNLFIMATVAAMAQDITQNPLSINNNADNEINIGVRGRRRLPKAREVKGPRPDKTETKKTSKSKRKEKTKEKLEKEPVKVNDEAVSALPTIDTEGAPEDGTASVLPHCPHRYNPLYTNFRAGDVIEMKSHIFECQEPPYEDYCNIAENDPSWNDTIQELFNNAWNNIGACEILEVEDRMEMVGETTRATKAATTTSTEPTDGATAVIEALILDSTTTEAPITTTTATTTTSPATTEIVTSKIAATNAATASLEEESSAHAEIIFEPPTNFPTYITTPEPIPACPPQYNSTQTYEAGEQTQESEHIFYCNEANGYEMYCNIAVWDATLLEDNANAQIMWNGAWVYVGACAATTLEELMDIEAMVEEIAGDTSI